MSTNEKKSSFRILVIDDNAAIHEDFRKILVNASETDRELEDMELLLFDTQADHTRNSDIQFEIEYAFQGQEGLDLVRKANEENAPFSLAFVDGRMPPGWDGIETISHLWAACPELQVVLCTAYADYSWQEIQKVLGESDSLLILKKPFDNVEVLQMAHALTRKWELNRDIKGRLHQLAFYDHLTGLPNRALFLDRLNVAISNHLRNNQKGALLFIDLNDFKRINDTLGHSVGDELLKIMAERLVKSLRLSDTVSRMGKDRTAARLGGDEFTVLLPEISDLDKAAVVSRRIVEHVARPVSIGNNEFIVTPSIGIAIFPDDGDNVETLLKNADLAMYFAKRTSNQGHFKYFQESKQFTHPDFLAVVEMILEETGMPADRLEVEVTESLFAQNMNKISQILKSLRQKNIEVAVDDFGTGYSSLSRLKDMPIDCLKIDRSFVLGINSGVSDKSIIYLFSCGDKGSVRVKVAPQPGPVLSAVRLPPSLIHGPGCT